MINEFIKRIDCISTATVTGTLWNIGDQIEEYLKKRIGSYRDLAP